MQTVLGPVELGFVHFMAYPDAAEEDGSLLASLQAAALDPFWGCVEIKPLKSRELEAEVADLFANLHMDVLVASQYTLLSNNLNLNSLDESLRRKSIDAVKADLEQAVRLGAPGLAVLSGPLESTGGDAPKRARQALVDSLVELCNFALEISPDPDQPLMVELETFDDAIDKRSLMGPSGAADALAAEISEAVPNFGLLLDLSHLPLLGESPEEAVSAAIGHLTHVHAGNCLMSDESSPLYGDKHPPFGWPGTENDTPELVRYLRALKNAGYFDKQLATRYPVFSFEVKPVPPQSPELLLADTRRVFEAALAELAKEVD